MAAATIVPMHMDHFGPIRRISTDTVMARQRGDTAAWHGRGLLGQLPWAGENIDTILLIMLVLIATASIVPIVGEAVKKRRGKSLLATETETAEAE